MVLSKFLLSKSLATRTRSGGRRLSVSLFPVTTNGDGSRSHPSAMQAWRRGSTATDPATGSLYRLPNPKTQARPQNRTRPPEPSRRGVLDLHDRHLCLDLVWRHQRAPPAARANPTGLFPGVGRAHVRLPERPGAALAGTHVVDAAAAGQIVEEDAVAVGQLHQTSPSPHAANE